MGLVTSMKRCQEQLDGFAHLRCRDLQPNQASIVASENKVHGDRGLVALPDQQPRTVDQAGRQRQSS